MMQHDATGYGKFVEHEPTVTHAFVQKCCVAISAAFLCRVEVNTNQYGRTFEDRSAKGSNSLFALPLCFKDTYLLR